MDIFRRTNKDREEKAGLQDKPVEKKTENRQMSQADFAYGPKSAGTGRPPMSKKWTEKGK